MDIDELQKKFPEDFPVDKLPAGAREEAIHVYRICRSGRVEAASFLPSYMDELALTKENFCVDSDIGDYSMSTFEKLRIAFKKLKYFRGKNPSAILAEGVTCPACGLTQRTKERTGTKNSHVDWWLYDGAKPYLIFKQVEEMEGTQNENS